MAAALLGAGSAMGTTTVRTAQMRWVGNQKEGGLRRVRAGPQWCQADQAAGSHAHRKIVPPAVTWTSSSARVVTVSPCAGAVTQMPTAWTAAMRKLVALVVSPSSLSSPGPPTIPTPSCGQVLSFFPLFFIHAMIIY